MSVPPVILFGQRNFLLHDPLPEILRARLDVDTLNESWQVGSEDYFIEGAPHPERPGMIIDQIRLREEIPGYAYVAAITALGDSRGTRPTKLLRRSDKRTLDIGWDEFSEELLTWEARWKNVLCTASTDIFTTGIPHAFRDGDAVMFRDLTGGAGITGGSANALGATYYVRYLTAQSFEVAATPGGSKVNVTSNLTGGTVSLARFVKGARHPDHAHMWLVEISATDDATDWRRVVCQYRGLMESKPYKRIITCNNQQMSSSEPIFWDFEDGWEDARYSQVNLPKIVCTDTYLTTDAPATDEIPWSQGEGATPPDAPDIRSLVITGDVDQITWHWPAGWSRISENTLDSIPLVSVNLKQRVTEFVWPVTLR
ncbi:MAG TPA: hypothetical protein PLP58_17315 [Prosthecobacter sp.]|nr:hypothetical protein [Prosthecobacter sp.]